MVAVGGAAAAAKMADLGSCAPTAVFSVVDPWDVVMREPSGGYGAPGRIRTRDLVVRSHRLCPLSYGRALYAQIERITREGRAQRYESVKLQMLSALR